ncbi:MAG: peptidase [Lentisphaeria bacterium]|nr:peptidase [Lentisphaeria bacterium]
MKSTPPEPEARETQPPMRPDHIQLLFVDGFGLLPGSSCDHPYRGFPALRSLLETHCAPLDATLGMPGIPQSATGQTALFTGVNAARELGRHVEGFPGARLRAVIEAGNLFSRLLEAGRTCAFANAYATQPGRELPLMFRSVTTVMTLQALGRTRDRGALQAGDAVYHDLTRETLRERGIQDVDIVTEQVAAEHLLRVMRTVHVCLFEYFLTDRVGHRGDRAARRRVLASLDRFVEAFVAGMRADRELLLLCSDHGNIEAEQTRGHTCHPVPWAAFGCGAEAAVHHMHSVLDVTPCVLRLAGVPREP